jgi:hypothetical protein
LDPGFDPAEEASMAQWWTDREAKRPDRRTYEAAVATVWRGIGCSADGAPYVVSTLAGRLEWGGGFTFGSPHPAQLAEAFLSPVCAGAKGLSARDRARLERIRDSEPEAAAPPTQPAPPSQPQAQPEPDPAPSAQPQPDTASPTRSLPDPAPSATPWSDWLPMSLCDMLPTWVCAVSDPRPASP